MSVEGDQSVGRHSMLLLAKLGCWLQANMRATVNPRDAISARGDHGLLAALGETGRGMLRPFARLMTRPASNRLLWGTAMRHPNDRRAALRTDVRQKGRLSVVGVVRVAPGVQRRQEIQRA